MQPESTLGKHKAARFQPAADVILGHGEAGAEQSHSVPAVGDQPVGSRFGNVQDRTETAAATSSLALWPVFEAISIASAPLASTRPAASTITLATPVPVAFILHLGDRPDSTSGN
ncbi:MAG: hypothetical protein WKF52_00260 [Sphingomicrobium sp.]